MTNGRILSSVIVKETEQEHHVISNLLMPKSVSKLRKKSIDEKFPTKLSPMPQRLLNMLTKTEIMDLVSFLEAGGYQLPDHLKHHHYPAE